MKKYLNKTFTLEEVYKISLSEKLDLTFCDDEPQIGLTLIQVETENSDDYVGWFVNTEDNLDSFTFHLEDNSIIGLLTNQANELIDLGDSKEQSKGKGMLVTIKHLKPYYEAYNLLIEYLYELSDESKQEIHEKLSKLDL